MGINLTTSLEKAWTYKQIYQSQLLYLIACLLITFAVFSFIKLPLNPALVILQIAIGLLILAYFYTLGLLRSINLNDKAVLICLFTSIMLTTPLILIIPLVVDGNYLGSKGPDYCLLGFAIGIAFQIGLQINWQLNSDWSKQIEKIKKRNENDGKEVEK